MADRRFFTGSFIEWLHSHCVTTDAGFTSPCWLWQGNLNKAGYGQAYVPQKFGPTGSKLPRIHRVAYQLLVGPIPKGLVIDHLCRNRSCCNPIHLEPVTLGENTRRGLHGALRPEGWSASKAALWARYGITETHCGKGHEFTPENTYVAKVGQRTCRRCQADWARNRKLNRTVSDDSPSREAA